MRLGSRLVLAVLTASTAMAMSVTPAGAARGPGAPGIGDPYYPTMGNGGYDVEHYDIRLDYEPGSDRLSGTTTIVARATQELTAFNLDFLLKVSSVRVDNSPTSFTQSQADGEVTVRLPATVGKGEPFAVAVTYTDTPSAVNSNQAWIKGWRRTADGAVSVGEPYQAEWWYPSNNHPLDKATYTVSVGVPAGVEALSNGVLLAHTTGPDGRERWRWRSSQPQVTHATLLAVGQFEVESTTTSSGFVVTNAYSELIPPDKVAWIKNEVSQTPAIIDFFSSKFGQYPFESSGGVIGSPGADGRGYGMETQGRYVVGWPSLRHTEDVNTVAHEVAHQWFGVSVSLTRWQDLWLNESMSTYAEYLWSEQAGERTVQQHVDTLYNRYPAEDPFWQELPTDPGPGGGPNGQFAFAVYFRGAMAMHALRKTVGDEDFFAIMRSWVGTYQYGNATADQFYALAERVSGKDLDEVFRTWLQNPGKPATSPG